MGAKGEYRKEITPYNKQMQKRDIMLESVLRTFQDIERKLSDPAIMTNTAKLTELSRERSKILPLVELVELEKKIKSELNEINVQIRSEKDRELKDVLLEEKEILEKKILELAPKIEYEILPKDPDAGKNIFLEIRAGTGGKEAALFARDLFRMYTRYFESISVPYEVVSMTESELNGFKEIILLVKGERAYDLIHREAGTHRVQRIPETEASGRIHTSACTIAIIPEVSDSEIEIDSGDLRIDTYRASGSGGQHINKTDSAVRITHIPSGLMVACQEERSQHKNKARAMKILKARLTQQIREEEHNRNAEDKKAQVGSGDRSEKIRTYNFPQNRLTDHRIDYTSHNLDGIMEGDLDQLIQSLLQDEKRHELEKFQMA
ncbi:MAG: peptide chain release factor 1 [Spirochaetia bacterium]|nr:peptide chain release factor 1 [Spirochaetia bacterium]